MEKEKEAIDRMKATDDLIAQKRVNELPSEILIQKVANLTRNGSQGNEVAHLLLPNLALSGVTEQVCWLRLHRLAK